MLIVLVDVIEVARLEVSFGTLLTAALLANFVRSVKRSIDRSDLGSVGHMEMMSTVIAIVTIAILAESQGLLAIFIGEITGVTVIIFIILIYRFINKRSSSSATININKKIYSYVKDLEQTSHCVFFAYICALYLFAEISEIATIGIGFIGSQLALACWQFASAHSVWPSKPGDRQERDASWHAHVVHDGSDKSHRRLSTSAMACLFLSSPLISYALFGELQTTFVGFAWLFCTAIWILLLNLPRWFFLQTHRSIQDPLAIANRALMACGILMTGGLMVEGALGAALGLLGGLTFGALSIAGRSYKQKLGEYGPQDIGAGIDGIVFSTILVVLFGIILTPLASGGVVAAAVLASFSIIVVLLVLS
ncbi:MAG: hypothetical protein HC869_04565 [Rhodospirillales bacterium]|nr:hypothetical protein [Rhodospirillales bacterium]